MNTLHKKEEVSIEDKLREIPEESVMLTNPDNKSLYPVFIDPFLVRSMRPHQIEGVRFMFECIAGLRGSHINGCILADSMGLGKTLQAITLIYVCMKRSHISSFKPLANKSIVVAPLTLLRNWMNEFKKWIDGTKLVPLIACGSKDQIDEVCEKFTTNKNRVLIISYEQFMSHAESLNGHCDLLIFDEGHRLKNDRTKTMKILSKFQCTRRIILTGTPLQNKLDEFYNCVTFVNPSVFSSHEQFKNVFSDPIVQGLRTDATPAMKEKAKQRSRELTLQISQFVLRRKAEILEKLLPPKYEYLVMLSMTDLQRDIYKKIVLNKSKKLDMSGEATLNTDVLGLMIVMRKLTNHPYLVQTDENSTAQELKHLFPADVNVRETHMSTKFIFMYHILEKIKSYNQNLSILQDREKVIIVSYWTQTLDLVQEMVQNMGLDFVRLDGKVAGNKRHALVDLFQQRCSNKVVFLLCAKAGGVGLNLTAATRMIMLELDWNPSNDAQVMGRIWRDGQNKPCHIYRLISCGTVEERILQRQQLKENLSMNVVDEERTDKSFDNEQLRQLFTYVSDTESIAFNASDNQLEKFTKMCPDYTPSMDIYMPFVVIKEKDTSKDTDSSSFKNEFEDNEAFIKIDEEIPVDMEEGDAENELELAKLAKQQLESVNEEDESMKLNEIEEDNEEKSSNELKQSLEKQPNKSPKIPLDTPIEIEPVKIDKSKLLEKLKRTKK